MCIPSTGGTYDTWRYTACLSSQFALLHNTSKVKGCTTRERPSGTVGPSMLNARRSILWVIPDLNLLRIERSGLRDTCALRSRKLGALHWFRSGDDSHCVCLVLFCISLSHVAPLCTSRDGTCWLYVARCRMASTY